MLVIISYKCKKVKPHTEEPTEVTKDINQGEQNTNNSVIEFRSKLSNIVDETPIDTIQSWEYLVEDYTNVIFWLSEVLLGTPYREEINIEEFIWRVKDISWEFEKIRRAIELADKTPDKIKNSWLKQMKKTEERIKDLYIDFAIWIFLMSKDESNYKLKMLVYLNEIEKLMTSEHGLKLLKINGKKLDFNWVSSAIHKKLRKYNKI